MAVATFDTYKVMMSLQKRGLSKDAAEGIVEAMRDITENNLVTKADLKSELTDAKNELRQAIADQTISIIKWVTGILIAHAIGTVGVTIALLQSFRDL